MSCKCRFIQGDVSGSYKIKNWHIEYLYQNWWLSMYFLFYIFKKLLTGIGFYHYYGHMMTVMIIWVIVLVAVLIVVFVVVLVMLIAVLVELVVLVVLVVMSGEDARPHSPCRDLALSQPVSVVECDTLTINLNWTQLLPYLQYISHQHCQL